MTYPPPPGAPDDDSRPSLRKDGQPESAPGGDQYPPPYPGGAYSGEQNPYPGPQYGDQQYGSLPPGQPQYGNQPYGQGQYGTPSYGAYGQQPYGMPVVAQTNGKAIGALVCGIAGLILCVIAGIPAIILGNMAVAEIDASGGHQDGRGMAVAGRVLGWVGVGLMIIALVVILIVVIAGAAST